MSELAAFAGSEGYGACDDERIGDFPKKQKPPDTAKTVIGQFPAIVMILALLAGFSTQAFPTG